MGFFHPDQPGALGLGFQDLSLDMLHLLPLFGLGRGHSALLLWAGLQPRGPEGSLLLEERAWEGTVSITISSHCAAARSFLWVS